MVTGDGSKSKSEREGDKDGTGRQHDGVPERLEDLVGYRPAGRDGKPEIPGHDLAQPDEVLDRDRLVETVGFLDHHDGLFAGILRKQGLQRIARSDIDQREANDADAKGNGKSIKQTPDNVGGHGIIPPDRQSKLQGLRACRLEGRTEGPEWWVESYSTTIGVRSWNQLCACTKPLTFGAIARGLTSWATHSITASSTIISCSLVSFSIRSFGSKER